MTAADTRELQESVYDDSADYRHGSPHLTHWPLVDRLTGVLREEIRRLGRLGLPLDVLEIGAGHGGYTEPALAAGCAVTAVEVSRPSVAELTRRFGTNPGFRAVHDPDGSLSGVGTGYGLVLCVSVLHHIPDYVGFLRTAATRLRPGGTLLALQDPLWYPRAGKPARLLDRAGYYGWRVGQGDLRRGLATLSRRVRGELDEQNPSDMVEYHVVRQGVDEQAVTGSLTGRFTAVELLPYWSNQSAVAQRIGERLGLANTFGVVARGARPQETVA